MREQNLEPQSAEFLGVIFVKTVFQDLKLIATCFSLEDGILMRSNSYGTAASAVAVLNFLDSHYRFGRHLSVKHVSGGVAAVKVIKVREVMGTETAFVDVEVSGETSVQNISLRHLDRLLLPAIE